MVTLPISRKQLKVHFYETKFKGCIFTYLIILRDDMNRLQDDKFLVSSYRLINLFVSSALRMTRSKYFIGNELYSLNLAHMIRKSLPIKDKKFINS